MVLGILSLVTWFLLHRRGLRRRRRGAGRPRPRQGEAGRGQQRRDGAGRHRHRRARDPADRPRRRRRGGASPARVSSRTSPTACRTPAATRRRSTTASGSSRTACSERAGLAVGAVISAVAFAPLGIVLGLVARSRARRVGRARRGPGDGGRRHRLRRDGRGCCCSRTEARADPPRAAARAARAPRPASPRRRSRLTASRTVQAEGPTCTSRSPPTAPPDIHASRPSTRPRPARQRRPRTAVRRHDRSPAADRRPGDRAPRDRAGQQRDRQHEHGEPLGDAAGGQRCQQRERGHGAELVTERPHGRVHPDREAGTGRPRHAPDDGVGHQRQTGEQQRGPTAARVGPTAARSTAFGRCAAASRRPAAPPAPSSSAVAAAAASTSRRVRSERANQAARQHPHRLQHADAGSHAGDGSPPTSDWTGETWTSGPLQTMATSIASREYGRATASASPAAGRSPLGRASLAAEAAKRAASASGTSINPRGVSASRPPGRSGLAPCASSQNRPGSAQHLAPAGAGAAVDGPEEQQRQGDGQDARQATAQTPAPAPSASGLRDTGSAAGRRGGIGDGRAGAVRASRSWPRADAAAQPPPPLAWRLAEVRTSGARADRIRPPCVLEGR